MTTAIAEQLASKGVIPRNVKFQLALAEFQNNGGEYGVALAMLNAAYGRGAAPRQNDDEGHSTGADKAKAAMLPSSPDRSAGQRSYADKASAVVPVAANKPGHAKRGLHAIGAVQAAVSKSLFDTTLLPDGRRLRDVRWSELPELATRYRRLSRIFMAVHNHAQPVNPDDTLDQIVSEDGLAQIISAVELTNDIQ
jgi:hypothetical protein